MVGIKGKTSKENCCKKGKMIDIPERDEKREKGNESLQIAV